MVRKAHGVCVSVRGKAQLFGPLLERSHTVLACCLMHGLRKKSKKDNSRIALMFSKKIYTKQSMQKLAAAKATTRTFCRHSMLHLLPCSTSTTSDDGCESA